VRVQDHVCKCAFVACAPTIIAAITIEPGADRSDPTLSRERGLPPSCVPRGP